MINNSPSFGMALKQDGMMSRLAKLDPKNIGAYEKFANKTHRVSSRYGVDVNFTERSGNQFGITLVHRKNSKIATNTVEQEFPKNKKEFKILFKHLKEEFKRLKTLFKIDKKFEAKPKS